jgi:triosephosphate isomerase
MRRPLIAGNWKLHKTIAESVAVVDELKPLVAGAKGVEIVIAPVFTALSSVSSALNGSGIGLAAQDCFWEEQGAFTGEVSPILLRDAGCSHVLVGHSERRQLFGETDESVNRKARAAVASGLTTIICVGETVEERENRATFTVVGKQVNAALFGFSPDDCSRIVIAYEPVWAIGTGRTATDEQAQEVHCYIRNLVTMSMGPKVAGSLRILYGGSVKPDNIRGLMSQPDIDGALIGGASLKAGTFAEMVNFRG